MFGKKQWLPLAKSTSDHLWCLVIEALWFWAAVVTQGLASSHLSQPWIPHWTREYLRGKWDHLSKSWGWTTSGHCNNKTMTWNTQENHKWTVQNEEMNGYGIIKSWLTSFYSRSFPDSNFVPARIRPTSATQCDDRFHFRSHLNGDWCFQVGLL